MTFSLVVLKTRQVDALRRFYGALGVEMSKEQHGKGPIHFAGRIGNVVLEVYPLPDDGTFADATTRLGFTITCMTEAIEALTLIDTPIVAQPRATKWGVRAVVRDPDGRSIELYEG